MHFDQIVESFTDPYLVTCRYKKRKIFNNI